MTQMSDNKLDNLIAHCFPDVAVDKGISRSITASQRAIPAFVRDWLVSRYTNGQRVDHERIRDFLSHHLPDKQQREVLRNHLLNGQELVLLDGYEVTVDLNRGERLLKIPSLDIFNARIKPALVERYPLLLSGPVWGAGRLEYRYMDNGGEVWMTEFQPMQTAVVDLDYYIAQRAQFTIDEWQALLIRSMGYNPDYYSPSQRLWLIQRLALLVQPRLNLIELAPKGTGKSYVLSQLSKYAWLISGGIVTRAKLFYDMHLKTPGVITKYDAVVLDEVQTLKLKEEGEIIGAFKGFLESGEFRVMGFAGNSEASFALLANIPIGTDGKPVLSKGRLGCYFDTLPQWLHGQDATALLDRFHGLIPGWELPRITHQHLVDGIGLRADYLSEILHALRLREEYPEFVSQVTYAEGDLRDSKAVRQIACALLRLLFPNLQLNSREFEYYCLRPAKAMRSLIREQLAIMDSEYKPQLATIEVNSGW